MAWPKGVSRTMRVVHYENGVPKCTDQVTYQRWKKTLDSLDRNPACDFCLDCNQGYQAKMIEAGRCENPDIRFRADADGMIEGYLPAQQKAAA